MKNRKIIFVIDNNEIDCMIAKVTTEKADPAYTVSSFSSADKALEALLKAQHNPDSLPQCIFLDLEMPLKTGWDFLNEYQYRLNNSLFTLPPVFVLTSSINPLDSIKAKSYPCVRNFILKPLTAEAIKLLSEKHTSQASL